MRYIPPYVRKMMQEEINNGNLSYNDLGETAKQTLTPPPKPKNTNPGSGNFKQLEEQQLREQASTPSYSFLTPTREAVAPPSMADFRRLDNEWVDNNKTFLEEEIESGRMNPQFAEKHPIIATGVAGLGRALTPIAELVAPDPVDKPSLRNINPRIRQEATNIMLGINEPLPETGTPWADIPSSMVGFGLGLMSGGGVNGVKSVGNIALRGGDEILQSTPQIAAKLATKTDKLTPLGQKIAKGAVGGATGGAGFGLMEGMSEGLSPTDTAKRMATDALMFGGMEAGMPLVGAGLKSASKTLGKGATKIKEKIKPKQTIEFEPEIELDLEGFKIEARPQQVEPLALTEGTNWRNPTPYETHAALEKQRPLKLPAGEQPLALSEGYYPNWETPSPYETFKVLEKQKPLKLTPGEQPKMLGEGYYPNWEEGTGYPVKDKWFADPYGNIREIPGMAKELPAGSNKTFARGSLDDPVISRSDIGDPAYLSKLKNQYNKMINDEVGYMKNELGGVINYRPDVNGPLLRASQNPEWYREFWAKNGRSPRAGEYRDIAIKNLIEGNKYTGEPANEEFHKVLSELSRGQKLPEEWHGLQESIRNIGKNVDDELKPLLKDMKTEQKKVEPFGLEKSLDRLTEIENNARKAMKDRMDFRKQYPDAIGIVAHNPLEDIKDLTIIGAVKIAKGTIKFEQWAKEMIIEFGKGIERQLPYIWQQSNRLNKNGETAIKFGEHILPIKLGEKPIRLGKGAFPVKEEVGQALDKSAVKNTPLKPSAVAEDMNSNTINIEEALNTVERQIGGNKGNTDYKTIESINSYSDIKNNVNIPEKVKQAYTKVVDRFDRLKDVDNHIDSYMKKTTGKGLSESEKLYKLGTNSTSAEGIAQQIMEKHLLDSQGNVVGKSFNEVIKGVADTVGKDNWRVFEDYNKLKHAMSWMRKGREVYPEEAGLSEPVKRIKQTWEQIKKTQKDKTLNKQQKEYVVNQLKKDIDTVASEIETGFINPRLAKIEQQIPSIKQASKDYNNWIAKFGEEWGVKTGLINPEEWALLRKEYPDYVPLQRVMDEIEEGLMGAKSGFANQVKPIKKGRGSERDTVESIEVMIERIPQYVKTAKRNEVAQNLYKMIQRNPEEMADAWGKVIEVKPGDPRKPNIITARVNGKEVSMELNDPALLDAMAHLSKKGQDIVTETVRKATGIMKTLTTGVNPFFSIGRNVFYDMPQAYQNSKTLRNFKGVNDPIQFSVDLMDSLVRIITNEKWHKEKYLQMYRDMGGGGFTSASAADRNLLAESKAKIMPGYIDAKKPLTSAGRLVQKGYGDLQRLMSVTETLPRLPEFKRAVQQGGGTYDSKIKGLYEANDITFNFSRHGEVSKFLDAYIPFFNAAVQGLDKEARAFKDNPVGKTANAIISVTIPTLLLYSINHDNPAYQQVSEATKSRYYLLPKEDGTFTKIVKPRESGTIFGTALEDMLDYMKDNDPKVFESFMLGIKNNFLPPARSIAAPALSDLRSNKDFADRPIVPGYMQGLSPELQYDANTSEPAKWLGKKTGISPKQIDFLARSYGGIVAQLGQPLTTEGVDLKETVKRQFVADPLYSNDVFSNFYEEVDRLDTSYKDSKSLGTPEPERKKRLAFNKVVTKLSDIRKKMRLIENNKTLDPEVKQEKLRKMQSEMINQAKIIQEKYKKTK